MRLELHPEALSEFQSAAIFYEQRQIGLGERFVSVIEDALQSIEEAPTRWAVLEQDIRRRLSRVFPYAIVYTIESEFIHIIAIMHCHQKPGYWKTRIPN